MLRKAMIALAVATSWGIAVPQAASACYGFAPCGGVGFGTYPPHPFYGNPYPDPYPRVPAYAYGEGVGCYLIRRPVLGLYGWQVRTVQVCD